MYVRFLIERQTNKSFEKPHLNKYLKRKETNYKQRGGRPANQKNMKQTELTIYLENLSALDRFKNNLSSLQIIWETDPNIDISVLASDITIPPIPGTKRHIELVNISQIEHTKQDLFNGGLSRYLELYKLIEQGVPIIPPIVHRSISFINGVQETVETRPIRVSDGYHRVNLAKWVNLEAVPVLFVDQPSKYTFSRSQFEISATETELQVVDKDSREVFRLELSNTYPGFNSSGDYEFHIHSV
jgi:hypothetical protein